jgi:hypothetical protein
MSQNSEVHSCVENISLAQDTDKRIAWASVRLGEVLIRGVAIWRGSNGRLRVFFPTSRLGAGWEEAVCLPDELRTQVEADVISAYKTAKAAAQSSEK